jgi:hypothetical protein
MENNLPSKISKNSNNLYYHAILDIAILIALLDNLICMDFINHENNLQKTFLVILSFKKTNRTYPTNLDNY